MSPHHCRETQLTEQLLDHVPILVRIVRPLAASGGSADSSCNATSPSYRRQTNDRLSKVGYNDTVDDLRGTKCCHPSIALHLSIEEA